MSTLITKSTQTHANTTRKNHVFSPNFSQNPKKSSLLGYSWNPVDQTTRQRVILATQDPLWSMNVPTALRSATVQMMRIVDGGDAARISNVSGFGSLLVVESVGV
eukprot:1326865-Amorphochlora_amoeboformis.AAC.1